MTGQASWLRAICYALMMLAGLTGPARAQAPGGAGPHLAIRLVAEAGPRAGGTVTLAIDIRPAPGWHGYWRNPGDAGFPASFRWTLPAGVSAGEVAYPVPTPLPIAGLMNYVYERPYALLVDLRVPAGLAAGTRLPVRLHTDYLVCSASVCVPEQADLATDLTVGAGAPAHRAAFDAWRRAIPKPLGAAATWSVEGKGARVAIPYPAGAPLADAYFFLLTAGALDLAAPQKVTRDGDRLLVETRAGQGARGALDGVLRVGPGQGLAVHARYGAVTGAASAWGAALAAFALAVLGGVVLNAMPCVFPILSLKAMSLARSGASARHARAEALAYTAGVVLVVVGLGAAILLLRAGGTSVGWAFQLQSPRVVLLLLLLTAGIAFNLAGLFEVPTPPLGRLAGGGGAFATGALAAVIATPCTGPFMGAALGTALVLPPFAALAVFFGLGLGLALPFLLIGFVPALRTRLPKPGEWMATMRQVLSVPMFLTAIALAWVLGHEAGVDALSFALVAVLAVAMLLWIAGRRQARGMGFSRVSTVLLIGVAVAATGELRVVAPAAARTETASAQPFSEARLASLRATKRPVFAYFTADWCFTCKVNERAAIDTDGVRATFARRGVAVLVGDWTNGDPTLGRFLEAHGRAGVPLYLYYAPGADARELPQLLTPAMLEQLGG